MKIELTKIKDLVVIEPRVFYDERGYFFESFNEEKFKKNGLDYHFIQDNQAASKYGVIRGLHFQKPPFAQAKLVRALFGKILDVAVDLRRTSPTYGEVFAVELSDENKKQLLVPRGFAHGYSVLSKEATVAYKCDNIYMPSHDGGILYNDKDLNIDWGIIQNSEIISEKDKKNISFAQYTDQLI